MHDINSEDNTRTSFKFEGCQTEVAAAGEESDTMIALGGDEGKLHHDE